MRSIVISGLGICLMQAAFSAWADSGTILAPGGKSLDETIQEEHLDTVKCKGSDLKLSVLSSKGTSIDQYHPAHGTSEDLAVSCLGTSLNLKCLASSGGIQNLLLEARHSSVNYTLLIKRASFVCNPKRADCLTDELVGFMLDRDSNARASDAAESKETLPFSAEEDRDGARTIWFLAKQANMDHEYVPAKDIPSAAWVKPVSKGERRPGDLVWWKEYVGLFDGTRIIRLANQKALTVRELEKKYGPAKYFRIVK